MSTRTGNTSIVQLRKNLLYVFLHNISYVGWHEAEVQSYDRDNDEVDVVFLKNPDWTYTIDVLPKLISGKLRLKQQLF